MYISGINFKVLMNKASMKITDDWLAENTSTCDDIMATSHPPY